MTPRSWTDRRLDSINARPATEVAVIRAFGVHVKRARESLGWSQAELADRASVSQTYVSRIEGGVQGASLTAAARIAAALGESVDALARVEEP